MKRHIGTMWCLLPLLAVAAGCNKTAAGTPAATAESAAPASAAPAASATISNPTAASANAAANAPTAAIDATAVDIPAAAAGIVAATSGADNTAAPTASPASAAPASAPVSAASTPARVESAAAAVPESPDTIRKRAQIEWALRQDEIKNDPNGLWAVQAKASSTYTDAQGKAPYAASQATGTPNIEGYGNNGLAWTPKTADAGIEWLDLQYAKPVHATKVRVRESYGAGAVVKVELFDEQGAPHAVWTGADSTKTLDYLVVEFPKTTFKTGRVKLTLATNVVGGWNEIDAVQLVGTEQ